jgi:hypothetical protein
VLGTLDMDKISEELTTLKKDLVHWPKTEPITKIKIDEVLDVCMTLV